MPPFTKGEGIRESGNRFPMLSAPFGNLGAVGFQMFAEGARFVEKCGCIGVIWPHTGGIFISLGMRPPARLKVPGGVRMSGAGILKARASIERPASKCKIRAAAVLIPLPRLAEIRGGGGAEKYYLEPGKIVSRPIIIETGGVIAGGPRTPDCESLGDRAEPAAAFAKCLPMPAAVCPGRLGRRAPLRPAQAGRFQKPSLVRIRAENGRAAIPAAIICGSRRRGRTKSRRAARRICAPERCAPKLPGFFPALSWGRLSEAPVSSGCGGESGQRAEPVLRAFPDFFPAGRCAPLTGIFRGLRFRIFRRIPADPPAAERAASARGRRPRSPPRPRAAPAALSAELPPFRA